MELEHSSEKEFTPPNYQINTSPLQEWKKVIDCGMSSEEKYPRCDIDGHVRRMPNWKLLLEEELKLQGDFEDACLTDVEIIAIILYTGPMVRSLFLFSDTK
jgi:hypothetical protein